MRTWLGLLNFTMKLSFNDIFIIVMLIDHLYLTFNYVKSRVNDNYLHMYLSMPELLYVALP